jgi:hypothetical protein
LVGVTVGGWLSVALELLAVADPVAVIVVGGALITPVPVTVADVVGGTVEASTALLLVDVDIPERSGLEVEVGATVVVVSVERMGPTDTDKIGCVVVVGAAEDNEAVVVVSGAAEVVVGSLGATDSVELVVVGDKSDDRPPRRPREVLVAAALELVTGPVGASRMPELDELVDGLAAGLPAPLLAGDVDTGAVVLLVGKMTIAGTLLADGSVAVLLLLVVAGGGTTTELVITIVVTPESEPAAGFDADTGDPAMLRADSKLPTCEPPCRDVTDEDDVVAGAVVVRLAN